MQDFTSLKIIRDKIYSWVYYPNGGTIGFSVSKGYMSWEESNGKVQIVENGRALRPKVLLENITFEDAYASEATTDFATYSDMQNALSVKGCPLFIDVIEVLGSGIPEAPSDGQIYGRIDGAWQVIVGGSGSTPHNDRVIYTGSAITVPAGFTGIITNMNDMYATVTFSVVGTSLTITGGANNDEVLLINGKY